MPGRDGTGPLGQGPQTGRGQGRCRVKDGERVLGRRGRGFRNRDRFFDRQESVKKDEKDS